MDPVHLILTRPLPTHNLGVTFTAGADTLNPLLISAVLATPGPCRWVKISPRITCPPRSFFRSAGRSCPLQLKEGIIVDAKLDKRLVRRPRGQHYGDSLDDEFVEREDPWDLS